VTTAGLLGITTFYLGMAVLIATAMSEEPEPRRVARLRVACAAIAALLVAGGLLGIVRGLVLAAAGVALVFSGVSIWLARRRPAPLASYLDHLDASGDDAWRDEFERPFEAYVRALHEPERAGE
jgi:hypothetical protein